MYAALALIPAPSQAATPGPPATVIMIAGNGEVVQANFTTNMPLTILVRDANNVPVGGVPVSWSISCASDDFGCQPSLAGTLIQPTTQTDSTGIASTGYNQSFVPPGLSFTQATVTATTSIGSVVFKITTSATLSSGSPALSAFLLKPGANTELNVQGGTTVPAAVQIAVSPYNGIIGGQAIPNVGLRIIDAISRNTSPVAYCNAPAGTALTNAGGVATCDLVIANTTGSYRLAADVGGGQADPEFILTVSQGATCTFMISPVTLSFPAAGGSGTINISTQAGCPWTATSNTPAFVTVTSGANGNGNGFVGYTVGTNPGVAARSGTISAAGQTFTVNQAGTGSGPGPLTISTGSTLPGAPQNTAYSTNLTASGGSGTYTWSITAGTLPPGLTLANTQNNGVISGTPTTAGTYTFTATVTDSLLNVQSQQFTIAVGATGGAGLSITTTTAANGAVGVAYNQPLSFTQSVQCGGPFSPLPVFNITAGSLPPGLSIQFFSTGYAITGTPTTPGTYPFTLVLSNNCSQSAPVSLSITVNGAGTPTILNASTQSLTFSVTPSGAAPPLQQVGISSTGSSVALTASSNVSWLSVTLSPNFTPATLTVGVVNYQSLTAGVYQGLITVAAPGNNFLNIQVTLNVSQAPPPSGLTVSSGSLSFALPTNSFSQQAITVLGSVGSPTVRFTASATTTTGAPWLGLTISGGVTPQTTVSGSTPTNLAVTVNTTGLPPGTYTGSVILQQQGTSLTLLVPVTLNVVRNTLTVDFQSLTFSFVPGLPPPAPQTVTLLSSLPVPVNVTTTTAAGGNWLFTTLSGDPIPTAVTVSVNPTGLARGTYNGTVNITPVDTTIPPVQVPVTLTISAGSGPVINGVVNAASNTPGPISAGEFVAIYGTGMGGTPTLLTLTPGGLISTNLNNTQVLFDGIPAPLVYVSDSQVNAIVPYEIFGRSKTQVQVQYNNALSTPVDLAVAPSAPGIFLCLDCQPSTQAAALNQNNTANTASNGAVPGTIVTLFVTGEGQTDPAGITGSITGSTLGHPLLAVSVKIGGLDAQTTYVGSAPSLAAGVLQINVIVPQGLARGTLADTTVKIGDATSNTAKLAIAP